MQAGPAVSEAAGRKLKAACRAPASGEDDGRLAPALEKGLVGGGVQGVVLKRANVWSPGLPRHFCLYDEENTCSNSLMIAICTTVSVGVWVNRSSAHGTVMRELMAPP